MLPVAHRRGFDLCSSQLSIYAIQHFDRVSQHYAPPEMAGCKKRCHHQTDQYRYKCNLIRPDRSAREARDNPILNRRIK